MVCNERDNLQDQISLRTREELMHWIAVLLTYENTQKLLKEKKTLVWNEQDCTLKIVTNFWSVISYILQNVSINLYD
jgi:hypothetical protein